MPSIKRLLAAGAAGALMLLAGCGSSSTPSTAGSSGTSAPATGSSSSTAAAGSSSTTGPGSSRPTGALSADARSAATGDIPDNQVFLVFHNPRAGYSMKYPEGWTVVGSESNVTFRDKNNLVHVTIARGAAPTTASMTTQLQALRHASPTLSFQPPQTISLGATHAIRSKYTTQSAPNPVTGRRVLLMVDRYEFARGPKVVTVDLGTPKGVDNVDAYRKMIESLRWR